MLIIMRNKKNHFDTEEFCLSKHVNYLFLTVEPANAYSFNEADEDQSHWCCMCVQESDDVLPTLQYSSMCKHLSKEGSQWLSGRVLDSRPKGVGFETHRRHCGVSLSKTH